MTSVWRVFADLVVGLHYAFLLYLVVGGFVAVRWPRTIWLHAAAAVWGVLILTTGVVCPLTVAQNVFRRLGDLPRLRNGFIAHYVTGTLYPASLQTVVQLLVGVLVATSWLLFARRRRRATLQA